MAYDRAQSNYAFFLKEYQEGVAIRWTFLEEGSDLTNDFIIDTRDKDFIMLNMDKASGALELKAKYGEKEIAVKLVWDFVEYEFTELSAKHKTNRIAKSGEVLYLVDPPSVTNTYKEVRYGITTNPKTIDESKIRNIKWYKDENRPENQLAINTTEITRNIKEDDNTTTYVYAGNPDNLTKGIEVKWVDEKRIKYEVIPSAVQFTAEKVFDGFKTIKTITDKFGKYAPKIEPRIKFTGTQFNEEDEDSRFYNIIQEGSVDASVRVFYDIPLPPPYSINLTVPYINYTIGEIGAYVLVLTEAGMSGGLRKEKRNDKQNFIRTQNNIALRGSGSIEFGARINVLPEVKAVVIDVKAYGKAKLSASGKVVFNTNGSTEFAPRVYFDPLVGGFKGKIKAGKVTIFNQKFEWQLIERIRIYPPK